MKNACIRYYLLVLYLMNLDVAKYAFDTSLSVDARVLCGIGMGIGLVNLWLALRLDAVAGGDPAMPGQVVKINVAFSLIWNVALGAVGSAQPVKFALGMLFGAIALRAADTVRAGAGRCRPQLLATA